MNMPQNGVLKERKKILVLLCVYSLIRSVSVIGGRASISEYRLIKC